MKSLPGICRFTKNSKIVIQSKHSVTKMEFGFDDFVGEGPSRIYL